jgi:hypothetical protein
VGIFRAKREQTQTGLPQKVIALAGWQLPTGWHAPQHQLAISYALRRGAAFAFSSSVTLKIDIASDGETATFRLSGRIEEDHLGELQAQVQRYRPRLVFDLAEATLVDLAVVRFLAAHEGDGVELLRCPRYIREWIARERIQGEEKR